MLGRSTTGTEMLGPCSCARMSVDDTVVPATSLEGFSVLVDAELVRTASMLEQSMLRSEFWDSDLWLRIRQLGGRGQASGQASRVA